MEPIDIRTRYTRRANSMIAKMRADHVTLRDEIATIADKIKDPTAYKIVERHVHHIPAETVCGRWIGGYRQGGRWVGGTKLPDQVIPAHDRIVEMDGIASEYYTLRDDWNKKKFLFEALDKQLSELDKLLTVLTRCDGDDRLFIEFDDGDYDDTNLYIIEAMGYIVHRPVKQVTVDDWDRVSSNCSALTCGYGCHCRDRERMNADREKDATHVFAIKGRILIP